MPEPSAKTTGGEENRSLEFHKNLGDERVHSFTDLNDVLKYFEAADNFERKTAPEISLPEFLTHEDNIQWGSLEYKYNHPDVSHPKIWIYLNYSPWLVSDKGILIQGRVVLEKPIKQYNMRGMRNNFIDNEYIINTSENNELAHIVILKMFNPNILKREVLGLSTGLKRISEK
jgi:hypothetical protein